MLLVTKQDLLFSQIDAAALPLSQTMPVHHTSVFWVPPTSLTVPSLISSTRITFSLPPGMPGPHTTVEDAEDEDSMLEGIRCSTGVETLLDDLEFSSDSDGISIFGSRTGCASETSFSSEPPHPLPRAPPPSPVDPESKPLRDGNAQMAPPIPIAAKVLEDLKTLLKGTKIGKSRDYRRPEVSHYVEHRLHGMIALLSVYVNSNLRSKYGHWAASSLNAAMAIRRPSAYCARVLRRLCRAYIDNREILPINPYVEGSSNMLLDEDLKSNVVLYLQGLGKDITAAKLQAYLNQPDIQEEFGIGRTIKRATANRYLRALDYHFSNPPKGQFVDGHERGDVVDQQQSKFLPAIAKVQPSMRVYDSDGVLTSSPDGRPL